MDRIIRKAIEIELQSNNINREDGFSSESHGSLSFATYGNEKPSPNKNTTHSGSPEKDRFLLSIHSLPRPLRAT
jgi:hypothetical protein